MMKHFKTRAVDQSEYVVCWNKAEEFYDTMQHAYKNRMWTSVGLNAVHCVISSCDALLVKSQGIRAAGDDHMQAVELLGRSPIDGIEKQTATVRRIIAKKNVIALMRIGNSAKATHRISLSRPSVFICGQLSI